MPGENVPINGPMLLGKAHSLAIQLNSDFQPNPSWLERLKKRENISFQKIQGEKRVADTEGAESWTNAQNVEKCTKQTQLTDFFRK